MNARILLNNETVTVNESEIVKLNSALVVSAVNQNGETYNNMVDVETAKGCEWIGVQHPMSMFIEEDGTLYEIEEI